MKNKTVWQGNFENYPELTEDIERETVVVGGGLAGFLTAFRLCEEGAQVTLIEADRLFSGTTGKTTCKISCNQETVYYDLYKKYGKSTAEKYYLSQKNAQDGYLKLIRKYKIKCDLIKADSYIFTYGNGDSLKRNVKLLSGFGADCEWIEDLPAVDAKFALKMNGEYMFDVLKFVSGLPKNFEIYEHTRAVEIDCKQKMILCDKAKIKAKNIVIATHYPIINIHGGYIFKLRQSEAYLLASSAGLVEDMYLDERKSGLTLRPYYGGTLIGGGDHRTGRDADIDKLSYIKKTAEKFFNVGNVTNFWSAEDVMTTDGMPMAGKYWKGSSGIYVITGFNKWGMTNSLACADVICDMILGRDNENISLFAPDRKIKGAFSYYIKNVVTTAKNVFLGYFRITFKSTKSIPLECGKIVRFKGKKRAVYKDEKGKLHIIGSMCPHLHGELKWNENSRCWECPCHGSKFDIHGNIISEPATKACKNFRV